MAIEPGHPEQKKTDCMSFMKASSSFQQFIKTVLHNLPHVTFCLDNLLITPKRTTITSHTLSYSCNDWPSMDRVNLRNLRMCHFRTPYIELMGHQLTREGIWPGAGHLQAPQDMPVRSNEQEVCQFLGLRNFLRGTSSTLPSSPQP
jgi:hypothetical protein